MLDAHHARLVDREFGSVTFAGQGIARVHGLFGVQSEELVDFADGPQGMAFNLDRDEVGVILLGDETQIRAGSEVYRTGRVMDVPVGRALLGRIVDATGQPLDDLGPIAATQRLPIERPAPPIMQRAPVAVPLQTGIKVIDALLPIGRGQRELILGDRQTGKSAIALDSIINQRHTGVICIYCAIGQRNSATAKLIADLRQHHALPYTIVVVAGGEDPPGLQFIAPYARRSMAEAFMQQGHDVLIVYDDLTLRPRLSQAIAAAAPPTGPRGLSGRHILYSRPAVGAGDAAAPGARRRFADGAAHYPNAGAGYVGLYSDQPDFDYRWPDLSVAQSAAKGAAAGGGCGQVCLARGQQGATAGLSRGGGRSAAGLCPV
ncbi:MAG: hypothetical protein R2911_05820 [Caldilineaceae bacterium]